MRKLLEEREQRRLAHYAVKLEGPTARSERSVLQWDSTKFNVSRGDLVGFKQEKREREHDFTYKKGDLTKTYGDLTGHNGDLTWFNQKQCVAYVPKRLTLGASLKVSQHCRMVWLLVGSQRPTPHHRACNIPNKTDIGVGLSDGRAESDE